MSTMTEQPVVLGTLDYQDIVALREADSVCFSVYQEKGTVRACLDYFTGRDSVTDQRVYSKREQVVFEQANQWGDRKHEVTVPYDVHGYHGVVSVWYAQKETAAFHMIHGSKFDRPWQTIVSLLKAGDVLKIAFTGSNNNGYLKDAGLHYDSMTLHVTRGKRRMEFLLGTSVSKDNSARMVKRHGM